MVLYSKPEFCLCDGLKEKFQDASLLFSPHFLHDINLQVRDITSNLEWERACQFEIPMLTKILSDGTKETLPKISPRVRVEFIQKKIVAALSQ
ncbi:hypothetical protein P3X46_025125 [Hevea brasiliensis]|uniref:Glutaredoxin-like protein n=1 Tax=Hevea brasiliensis TaxID=3981 RepID=A0ABQ9L4J1_HEVBR|nr:hypothetical protein P3X46_025125 [Hevea brasiliensis]